MFKKYLLQQKLIDTNYKVPLVFYMPGSPLQFKEYTETEQNIDILLARAIYENQKLEKEKYKNNGYQFLLGLSSEEIK